MKTHTVAMIHLPVNTLRHSTSYTLPIYMCELLLVQILDRTRVSLTKYPIADGLWGDWENTHGTVV